MKRSILFGAAIVAAATLPALATQSVSTNPDTPTTLKQNTIVGAMHQGDMKSFDNYYTFTAGPGALKVRATFRGGPNAGQLQIDIADEDGAQLTPGACVGTGMCNGNDLVAGGQGDHMQTGTFQVDAKKTLVMHVHGSEIIYHDGTTPTYRIMLEGDVNLDKTAKPLKVVNH
jgi:opacity protein-like surface antigen